MSAIRALQASARQSRLLAETSSRLSAHYIQTRSVQTQPAYEGHIPLNWFETGLLTIGSAYKALTDPRRGGLVLPRLRDIMLASTEGRQILKERPRISTRTVDLEKLALLPEGTVGHAYISWLERTGVTPDTREPVHYIDDPELAYVMQRYRECHDLYHCIFNLPVNFESELALKYFEFANLGLPMAGFAAAFAPLRLNSEKRARLFNEAVPWAIKCGTSAKSLITIYWEKRWEQDVKKVKEEFGIWDPPVVRWRKPLNGTKLATAKAQRESGGQ
ncbi:unnamed protein product [Somion occarium]|uniref:4-hydroxy-3-methoxy-5-polyprenylbenzoate decarboxylase n=1 Tax=Somion occarium TaxID=3059160 RepID=A0ABP1EBA3_9APHY